MASTTNSEDTSGEHKARVKDVSRESRLSFRNFAEHQMRREFKEKAIEKCREPIQAFGKCAQESGLMVVWKCRDLNKALNECMAIHNSKEAFEKHIAENAEELDRKTIRSKS